METNKKPGTTITTGGVLTVAADEALDTLTVKATSDADSDKSGTAAVTVSGGGSNGAAPTWTAVSDSKFGSSEIRGIAWGGGKFVAVGDYGKMAYSPDGETWMAVEDSTFGNYSSSYINVIAWGGAAGAEKFVAVGGLYGGMAHSPDGVTWTAVEEVEDSTFYSGIRGIAWGGGKFVAVGSGSQMAHSLDGVTWTAVEDNKFDYSNTSDNSINGIAWGSGKFVAVGDIGEMAYSPDGVTWTAVTGMALGYRSINGIAWGSGKFVAVGDIGEMAYSPDGVTWTAVSDSTFGYGSINGIAWGGAAGAEKFVAVGYYGSRYESKMAYSD